MARIVFDLDGTLVDTVPSLAAAGNAMLAEFGRPPLSEERVASFVGNGVGMLARRMLEATGGLPEGGLEPVLARFHAIYDADPVAGTRPYPGVGAALDALAGAGHRLGVCTQKRVAPARVLLQALGLMPPLAGLTGGDSIPVLKPDPRMLLHAAAQLGEGPVVMVGDSEVDAETARRADVPFLLHLGGYLHRPVDEVPHRGAFGEFSALPDLIASLATAAAP